MSSNLYISPTLFHYNGVADFNNNRIEYVSTVNIGNDDFGGDGKVYKWKMWLDQDSSWANNVFNLCASTSTIPDIRGMLLDSSICFSKGIGVEFYTYDISGYDSQILNCELYTGYGLSSSPTDFKINGISISPSEYISPSLTSSYHSGVQIGDGVTTWSEIPISDLDNGTIWNFSVETSLGVVLHQYAGYPNGDTSIAWEDTVGNLDPITVGPSSTRDVQGYESGTTVLDSANKLEVNPSGNSGILLLQGIVAATPIFSFTTNASTDTFDPTVTPSAGVAEWDLGDGSIVNSNSVSHDYTQAGNKTVDLYLGTISSGANIEVINIATDNVVGTLDLTEFTGITEITIDHNPALTSVIHPPSSGNLDFYRVDSCDITGSLDFSDLNISGSLFLQDNPNLTSVIFGSNSDAISYFNVGSCDITGTLDVSGLAGLGGGFYVTSNSNLTDILFHPDVSTFTTFSIQQSGYSGVLDVSAFVNLSGSFFADRCPSLTGILFPQTDNSFSFVNAWSSNLTGTLDLSPLTNLSGQIRLEANSNLTGLILPTSSGVISRLSFRSCNITGVVDASGLTNLGTRLYAYSNPNLTGILNPTSSRTFSQYLVNSCNLTGTLDLTTLTGLGGEIQFASNPNLTEVLNPSSTVVVTKYQGYDCSLAGTLDVSGYTNLGGILNLRGNDALQEIVLPSTFTQQWIQFDVADCSLNQSTVDGIFSKMNTYYSSNSPTNALDIDTAGGTNMPPTDGSSNSDILSLETIFGTAGQSLTININT